MQKHSKNPSKYLDSLGIKDFRDQQKFWMHLEKKHGVSTCEHLDNALGVLRGGNPEEFYQAIYKDLAVSLDIGSMRRDLYYKFLEYFIGVFPKFDGTLLDIGCGNGLLTCFYALLFPTAKIIGIDKIGAAIDCSRKLAEKLSLTNSEFFVVDCESESWPLIENSVDLAISMTGLEPFKNATGDRKDGLFEWATQADMETQIPAIKSLSRYMSLSGLFVSVDRLPTCEDEVLWMRGIQNAGFGLELEVSTDLTVRDFGSEETLPIIVSRLGGRQVTSAEALSFSMARGGGLDSIAVGGSNYALAELIFASMNPKTIITAWTAAYHDGSGIAHFEIWQSGVFVVLYSWTTTGYRELKLAPLYLLSSTIQNTEDQMDSLISVATVSKSELKSLLAT